MAGVTGPICVRVAQEGRDDRAVDDEVVAVEDQSHRGEGHDPQTVEAEGSSADSCRFIELPLWRHTFRQHRGLSRAIESVSLRGHARSLGRADVQHDLADAFDAAVDAVARLQRAHAFGRAGEDQVAGLQVIELRQVGDQLGDVPDQLVEVGLLSRLAVDASSSARPCRAWCRASARSPRRPTTARRPCRGPTAGPCRGRRAAGRGASCRGRRHSRRSAGARRPRLTRKPGAPIATTSSISWW